MKLNKTIALVVVILLAAGTLLGCGAKPVLAATVGDQEVTVLQLENSYKNSLSYASAYGFDTTTEEGVANYRDYLLNNLVSSAMKIYQEEQAEITLTDEEMAAAKETAKTNYDDTVQSFVDQWLQLLSQSMAEQYGLPSDEARRFARLRLACIRGLMLDLLLTQDQQGVADAAQLLDQLFAAHLKR